MGVAVLCTSASYLSEIGAIWFFLYTTGMAAFNGIIINLPIGLLHTSSQ